MSSAQLLPGTQKTGAISSRFLLLFLRSFSNRSSGGQETLTLFREKTTMMTQEQQPWISSGLV